MTAPDGLAARLTAVRDAIAAAATRCGRDPAEVALLAVSKTRPAETVAAALALGQRAFGENRVQELVAKAEALAQAGGQQGSPQWHMIGSLQTNKVRELLAAPGLVLLHSLDRGKLADRLQQELAAEGRSLDVLLQPNLTGEPSKHGVAPEDAEALVRRVVDSCPNLRVTGLMAMAAQRGDPSVAFTAAARLRDRLRDAFGLPMPTLSLGMTGDLEAAIAAGSTLVRVGTGVFGPR